MFGNKLYRGVGYPTPLSIPDEVTALTFCVPNDETWAALVMGVMFTLTDSANWQQFDGGITQEEAAARWLDMWWDLGDPTAPAPYWDTPEDADDEATIELQTWYGQIVASEGIVFSAEDVSLTFLDNLGIWLIAGFIAYAGLPGAAIAFVPIAKRFTLAFKQNSLGGVVKALLDFAPLAEIDTYGIEEKIVELGIVMPDDDMPHTLYVELSDENPHGIENPSATVIRKELKETDITPAGTRYNSDCDCVQITPDGGTTWNNAPDLDPRYSTALRLPALSTDTARCDAAARMTHYVQNQVHNFITAVGLAQAATGALGIMLIFAGGAGIILDAIIAGLELMVEIGVLAIDGAFTDEVYNQLECTFFCHISENGQMSHAQLLSFQADVFTNYSTVIYDTLNAIGGFTGEVQYSNAGVEYDDTGDCDGCGCAWHYRWVFSENDGGFVGFTDAGDPAANYVSGQGWRPVFTSDGSGFCDHVYNGAFASATPVDIGADTTITDLYASGDNGDSIHHMELWVGANRTAGLTNPLHIYQDAFNGHAFGEITDESSCIVGCSLQGCDASAVYQQIDIIGTGTPPTFSGGAFV